MRRRVVVFCSDVYSSLGLVRSLGEAGYRPECYCYGANCDYILASKYISQGKSFPSASDVLSYLLNDYPSYQEKPVLYTLPDPPAYLVDQHLDQLKDKFVLMNAGQQGALGYWMNKKTIAEMARKHGLNIPWTIELSKGDALPDTITYPVFTKSIKTVDGGKCDEGICWNRAALEEKISSMNSDVFLVQEYVKKKLEICYFGLSLKGKVYIDYHDEISRFPDGAFGYYGPIMKSEHDETWRNCVSMMEEIGYDGLFDIEFLLGENGKLYFMEVNFRVDGAIYKLTPGINLPAEWCRLISMAADDLPDHLPTQKTYFTGITEVYDFKYSVLSGQMNVFKWFWQFCRADQYMLLNGQDMKPVFVWAYRCISRKFHRQEKTH